MRKNNYQSVILITRQQGLGGTERRMVDLSKSLCEENFVVQVVFIIDKLNKSEFINRLLSNPIARLLYIIYIIKKYRPGIVHAFDLETGIYTRLASFFSFEKFKIISGCGAGNIKKRFTLFLLKKGVLLPDAIICNSNKAIFSLKQVLKKEIPIYSIRNGLDETRLKERLIFEKSLLEKSKGRKIVGYIGKFNDEKRADRIFELAKYYHKNYSDQNIFFLIIGEGPMRESIIEEISKNELPFHDFIYVPGEIVNAGLLARHFFVGLLCSDTEGFPNVLLEYMYYGVPWISTNVGDVSFITEQGKPGIVIQNWNVVTFSEQLKKIVEDEELRDYMSFEGKRIFEQEFALKRMSNEIVSCYNELN